MEQKITLHGHIVSYDEETTMSAIRYLKELNAQEIKVFFDQAYNHGFAVFQDRYASHFKLVHQTGEYQLLKV